MKIVKIDRSNADKAAELVADFRVTLRSYKGIKSQPDIKAGMEEITEFLESGFPMFAAEDTVFNFVHPNNDGMIGFLRSKGYTVLNMIEIRKPYKGEELKTTIHVENNFFDY